MKLTFLLNEEVQKKAVAVSSRHMYMLHTFFTSLLLKLFNITCDD